MADGQRIQPVNRLVLHHSVGPDFKDVDHDTIAKWFSDIGKNRGYAGTPDSKHYYTPSNGKRYMTYAQAHMAGHWHNGKYCLFDIMEDKWNNVAWHAGNWAINQQSIGIENCGNYVGKTFTTAQRIAVADFWRPQDKKLNGATYINGHKDFSATACPGGIYEAIDSIVHYINNPPAPPAPVDPCKAVKDELTKTRSQLAVANETIKTLNSTNADQKARISELEQSESELQSIVDAQDTELVELEKKLAECQAGQPEQPCMDFWSWLKCKLGINKEK